MKWKRGLLIFALIFFVLAIIAYYVACWWAKKELERRAQEVLEVPVQIGDVGLSPFSKSLVLEEIKVEKMPFLGDALTIKEARVRPDWGLLWDGKVRVVELTIQGLSLRGHLTIPALPPVGDLKKIKAALAKEAKKDKSITLPQPLQSIIIKDSTIELTLTVGKASPNTLTLRNVQYQNQNINTISPTTLLTQSTFSFDVGAGHVERAPGRFSAKNIELSLISTLLSPSDYFRFSAGTMDLDWKDGTATVALKGVTLSKAISLLSANGSFDLEFTIPISKDSTAEADVRVIASEFWIGLWKGVLEKASEEAKKQLMQEAAKAVLGD